MRIQVRSKEVTEWPEIAVVAWREVVASFPDEVTEDDVVNANYFTPRPWRNEYDPGSTAEGFVYTTRQGGVWQVIINGDDKE